MACGWADLRRIVVGLLVALTVVPASPGTDASAAVAPAGAARFVALDPLRLVDTRVAEPGPIGRLGAGEVLIVRLPALAELAGERPRAVAVNLVGIDVDGPGYLTAWPTDRAAPFVSSLNLPGRGAVVPNFAILPVAPDGSFSLRPSVGMDVVVDLTGVFVDSTGAVAAGRFVPMTPSRLADTRSGDGGLVGPLGEAGTMDLQVGGRAGIAADAIAAVLSVTATEAAGPGFVASWPAGRPRPVVSTLNVPAAGATVTNLTIAPLGRDGRVSFFAQTGAHLVVDVVGWMTGPTAPASTAGLFVASGPSRVLDTREATRGALVGRMRADVAVVPTGVAPDAVAAVAANVTVTETSGPLYLTAYAARTPRPFAAALTSDRAGQTVGSFTVVPTGVGGAISLTPLVRTHAVVDVTGVFLGRPAPADPRLAVTAPLPTGTPDAGGFDAEIRSFLAANGYPGASVAVAKDGVLVHVRTYGTSDVTTGEPMRVDHHLRVASQSKVLTAVTVMRLVAAGSIGLDTPVWPLLDSRVPLPRGADARLRSVTIRHLLGHTSGLSTGPEPFFNDDATIRDAFGPNGASSCESAARWYVALPPAASPGTRYGYANMNYCLLSLVVEVITGRPWTSVTQELVLSPRGVVDMYPGRTYGLGPLDVAHVTPPPGQPGGGWFMESLAGAGAWMGTPADMVRVLDGLDAAKPGADLLTPSVLAEMTTRPPTDGDDPAIWYGLGLMVYDAGASWGHSGSLQGSRTMMLHQSDGITWCIMVNARFSDHADVLRSLMSRALARSGPWPVHDLGPDLP